MRYIKIYTILAFLLSGLISCKREKTDFIGPAYISAPEGFAVSNFTASPGSVNFATGNVMFNATFTHAVTWTLTITGKTSGAVRIIQGTSDKLENVKWTGTHDGVAFFRRNEVAVGVLSFFGTNLTAESNEVTLTGLQDFTTCGFFPRFGDFESNIRANPPYWNRFNVTDQGVSSNAVDFNGKPVPSVQGNSYYYMRGLGNDRIFVDGIQYIGGMPAGIPEDATKVWFNIYLYGTGDPNASVNLELQEADGTGATAGYQGEEDDGFVATVNLNHTGWKLFSFKYSTLLPSQSAAFGGSGNKKHEPHNLQHIVVALLKANNPDKPVEVYFDFPIITVGGPFKPCK
ncbi:MAG: hypothetical protein ACK40G_18250 [Cytophagaceae bacterium]